MMLSCKYSLVHKPTEASFC